MRIKICGLTRMEDIEAVNCCLPDYIGFVFAESRRKVSRDHAAEMKEKLHPSVQSAGVFVNEPICNIISLCREHVIDIIQLHGDEGEEEIRELREAVTNPIIKAVRVKDHTAMEAVSECSADYILLDAFHPDSYGGSGHTFDWKILDSIASIQNKPFFLAGGIDCSNIEEAAAVFKNAVRSSAVQKSTMNFLALDVSSGVETDGYKDPEKIRIIIDKIRRTAG